MVRHSDTVSIKLTIMSHCGEQAVFADTEFSTLTTKQLIPILREWVDLIQQELINSFTFHFKDSSWLLTYVQ